MRKINYFWFIVIVILFAFLWLVSEILVPFIVGILLAYVLNPSLLKLKKMGLNHYFSVFILLMLSFLLFFSSFIFMIPLFIKQFNFLLEKVPFILDKNLNLFLIQLDKFLPFEIQNTSYPDIFYKIFSIENEKIISTTISFLTITFNSGLAFINVFGLILITPIIAWYILSDWDKLIKFVKNIVPQKQKKIFENILNSVDKILSSFFRGQLIVSIILVLYYLSVFLIIGVEGAFAIALLIGILTFLPYIGSLVGLLITLSIAGIQFGNINIFILIIVLFVVGQLLESYFLTPRFIGRNVGLHPAVIIFSLLAGGAIFGFVGVLLAVPITAILFSFILKNNS